MEVNYPQQWIDRVGKFAEAIGKPLEEVTDKLRAVVGDPTNEAAALEALAILDDVAAVPDSDLKEALKELSIPSGKLNMHLAKLRVKKAEEINTTPNAGGVSSLSILPSLPDDVSFLSMLQTDGVLKVDVVEVISAIKAALARKVGLYDLPERIAKKMEEFAVAQEEPCGKEFYQLQKMLTEKRYGDVLSAVGLTGNYMSEGRKKEFFQKIDTYLWESLDSFHKQLVAWQQSWMQGMNNPSMLVIAMTASHSGGAMPPGIMAPPDTSPLRAAGEEFNTKINKIFAGAGIPIARALAYDATRIMGIVDNKDLPAQTGMVNKDQMLKELGVSVGSAIVQQEQALTKYALAIMTLPKITKEDEVIYFDAMIRLGANIPWDRLGKEGIGTRNLRE